MANAPVEVKRSPLAPDVFRAARSDMDRLFDRFARSFGLPFMSRMFEMPGEMPGPAFESSISLPSPAVDVSEDVAAYKITAELPGMSEKDVEVTMSGDRLILRGEKKQEMEKKEANYYLTERAWGSFQRTFMLPENVDREKISAEFAKGVLTLTLPKTAQAQAQQKKIEVKGAN